MKAPLPSGEVLFAGDASVQGVQGAWRAALVARELGTTLRLLGVRDPAADAGRALRRLAEEIGSHMGLPVAVEEMEGDPLAATVRAARDAVLVVIASRRGNPLREFVLGTQAERLIRLFRVPVLVVKKPPGGGYRRVLVPVELGPAARGVIAAATRLSRGQRMEVLHALHPGDEIAMRVSDVPQNVLRRLRRRAAQRAEATLQDLIEQSAPQPEAALPMVGFGDPAALVLARAQALRADLLVMGKRRRGVLAEFLLGSVTRQVLAAASADVLVMPPGVVGESLVPAPA